MRPLSEGVRREAIRLRVQERASISTVQERLGISRGAASSILKDYPLEKDELRERHSRGIAAYNASVTAFKDGVESSRWMQWLGDETLQTLTSARKGRIAEAAVSFRLAVLGYDVLRSVFEGHCVDLFAVKDERMARIQVKWAAIPKHGRPLVRLTDHKGRKTIASSRVDFVVGYNLATDKTYVFSVSQCEGRTTITGSLASEEAWHLLEDCL